MYKMGESQVCLKRNIPVSLEMHGWNVKPISPGRMLRWLDDAKKGASEATGSSGSLTATVFHCIRLWIWQLCQTGALPLASEQPVPIQVSQHVPFSCSFGERTPSHSCPMAQPDAALSAKLKNEENNGFRLREYMGTGWPVWRVTLKIRLVLWFFTVVAFIDKNVCLTCTHVLSLAPALVVLSLQVLPRQSFITTWILNRLFLPLSSVEIAAATLTYSQINMFTPPTTQPASQQVQN